MPSRGTGLALVLASFGFWLCWALMPGVGITDTAQIFPRVARHRASVLASVVLQLASAAAYAPASAGLLGSAWARESRAVRIGTVLLLAGAMGSAADAVFHLVAYEMTAPGIATDAMVPVMIRLQGPDLALLLPLVAAFFAAHAVLAAALRRKGRFARAGFAAIVLAPVVAAAGAAATRAGLVPGRIAGLATLAALAGSLALVGAQIVSSREASS
jgi:hypothetical protein